MTNVDGVRQLLDWHYDGSGQAPGRRSTASGARRSGSAFRLRGLSITARPLTVTLAYLHPAQAAILGVPPGRAAMPGCTGGERDMAMIRQNKVLLASSTQGMRCPVTARRSYLVPAGRYA